MDGGGGNLSLSAGLLGVPHQETAQEDSKSRKEPSFPRYRFYRKEPVFIIGIPLTYPQSENWTTVFFYGTHFIIPLNNT